MTTTNLFSISIILSFQECYIHGTIQYVNLFIFNFFYRSFTSLGRFIPRYFILFVAMVNGIVSLISLSFFFFFFFNKFIYLFSAVLGLRFCARAFSSCGEWGPLFIAVRGPLTVAASPVAEHRLQTRRLSSWGSRA